MLPRNIFLFKTILCSNIFGITSGQGNLTNSLLIFQLLNKIEDLKKVYVYYPQTVTPTTRRTWTSATSTGWRVQISRAFWNASWNAKLARSAITSATIAGPFGAGWAMLGYHGLTGPRVGRLDRNSAVRFKWPTFMVIIFFNTLRGYRADKSSLWGGRGQGLG